jgi:anti-sigma regulatory factor (Ser/Thr protein kinase)
MEVFTSSELVLPYTASSVGEARRRLIGDLAVAGIYDPGASDVALVLSELISNALRHATPLPGFTLLASWRLLGDSVEVAVCDGGGETVPTVHQPTGWAIGGRGLGIVDRLSLRWGVSGSEDGKTTVWARLPVLEDSSERVVAGSGASAG